MIFCLYFTFYLFYLLLNMYYQNQIPLYDYKHYGGAGGQRVGDPIVIVITDKD